MLATVAPRWPRAFSSIGIGAIQLFLLARTYADGWLAGYSSVSGIASNRTAEDLLSITLENISPQAAILLGPAALFFSYTVGEILILFGRASTSKHTKQVEAQRVAKIALLSNQIISDLYERMKTSSDLLFGVGTCFIFTAMHLAFVSVASGKFSLEALILVITCGVFGYVLIRGNSILMQPVDDAISSYEGIKA